MEDRRNVEESRRLTVASTLAATALTLVVLGSTWGSWRSFAIVGAIQGLLIPFNVLVNTALLPRLGARRGELLRTAVNAAGGTVAFHVAGWPLLSWLFLPFVALATD